MQKSICEIKLFCLLC